VLAAKISWFYHHTSSNKPLCSAASRAACDHSTGIHVEGAPMSKRRKISLAILALVAIAALGLYYQWSRPAVQIVVSPDTTYLTKPLTADGQVDYVAALNRHYGRGATPKNNAAIPLWELAHEKTDDQFVREYFAKLGVNPPKYDQPEWIPLVTPDDYRRLQSAEVDGIMEDAASAMTRPWPSEEFPEVANWLASNESQLAQVVAASRLPLYFSPINKKHSEQLCHITLPAIQGVRGLGRALVARAMRYLEARRYDDAWEDLLATLRLGRLVMNSPTLVESLVGVALQGLAIEGLKKYLQYTPLTAAQAQAKLAELNSIPSGEPAVDKINRGERYCAIDAFTFYAQGQFDDMLSADGQFDWREEYELRQTDWNVAMRELNKLIDRCVATASIDNPARRWSELVRFCNDADHLLDHLPAPSMASLILFRQSTGKVLGQRLGTTLAVMLFPAFNATLYAEARTHQHFDLLLVGFRLAAFHTQHGKYPATLAELEMHDGEPLPIDRFTGNDVSYRTANGGYLLYSFGPNEEDNGGRTRKDTSDGRDDDITLRIESHETN
jgi:hypothetical protein